MDTNTVMSYATASIPALVSTGITFLYIFLKVLNYITHAISDKVQRREAVATKSASKQEYSGDTRTEGSVEIQPQIQRHFYEQADDGRRPRKPTSGTVLLSREQENICIPAYGNDASNPAESPI